jgi:hypothetical protein
MSRFSTPVWHPLYKWGHKDLWIMRKTGLRIADDVALFKLVRGGTETNNPKTGTEISHLVIHLGKLKQSRWGRQSRREGAIYGPDKMYSEYWLAFLHDLVMPQDIRVAQTEFWSALWTPWFFSDRVMERMRTDVAEHMDLFRKEWSEAVNKKEQHLFEIWQRIVRLPFVSSKRNLLSIDALFSIEFRFSKELWILVKYCPHKDTWFVHPGVKQCDHRAFIGNTLAEAWGKLLKESPLVYQDSQYDDWVESLPRGEELVNIRIYEALNAGNPVIWPGSQFVEWMNNTEDPSNALEIP